MADSSGPSTVTMQYFHRASRVKIGTGNFSTVNGVQNSNYNYYVIKKRKENIENLPRFREFTEVKQGDILKDKDVCEFLQASVKGKGANETAVYTAEIIPCGSRKFTVKAYNGRKAKKAWRRDFLECSNDWRREIPLFGYNKSSVPLLIFHGELVPIAHIETKTGLVERLYFDVLRRSFGCATNELWLDPTKGNFCRGPAGPKCRYWGNSRLGTFPIPSDVGFLKEDALIRYFSSIKYDLGLLSALDFSYWMVRSSRRSITANYRARIVSSLTNSSIAFMQNTRWRRGKGCLGRKEVLPNGMTRFLLRQNRRFIEVLTRSPSIPWLLQSLSVFHAHNIQLDEDLSIYQLARPFFTVTGTLKRSKRKRQRRRQSSPIFFFLLPSPSLIRHFYYWSHDPAGGIPLSRAECKYLGLPSKLSIEVFEGAEHWSTNTYKTLHDYQISRGFDPRTTDFARFLGYNTPFEIVPPEDHFEEVDEDRGACSVPEPESSLALNNPVGRQEEGPIVPKSPDDSRLEMLDDDYSLDFLFKEIEIKGSAHIEFANLSTWSFTHRGTKPSTFTITAQKQARKQSDREEWSDVD